MTFAVVANTKFTDTETQVEDKFWSWIENIPVRGLRKKTIQKNKKIVIDKMSIFHQDYLSLYFRKFRKDIISQEYENRDVCALAYDMEEDLNKTEYGKFTVPTELFYEMVSHLKELRGTVIPNGYFTKGDWQWHTPCEEGIIKLGISYETTKVIEEIPTKM